MTPEQWRESTDTEKAQYLLNARVTVESKTGIRADAKVNDPNPTVNKWFAYAGGVQVSNGMDSSIEAMRAGLESLTNWSKHL